MSLRPSRRIDINASRSPGTIFIFPINPYNSVPLGFMAQPDAIATIDAAPIPATKSRRIIMLGSPGVRIDLLDTPPRDLQPPFDNIEQDAIRVSNIVLTQCVGSDRTQDATSFSKRFARRISIRDRK